jgi:hypothetical protein
MRDAATSIDAVESATPGADGEYRASADARGQEPATAAGATGVADDLDAPNAPEAGGSRGATTPEDAWNPLSQAGDEGSSTSSSAGTSENSGSATP